MEEDIKILEHYEIDVVEYPNGYRSVRDNKDNTFSKGIYIYATEEYGKNEIDNLLKNAIPKSKIKEKIEKYKKLSNEFYEKFLETDKTNIDIHDAGISCDAKVQVLQELMEDK